ncbi:MAG: two-component system, response regulator PdtaR [Thermoleophilaceae bacterium]|jgi:response regulator NasT|nr:two-component system, response regulator PdtaR [Thermoleophilaceae bacterium]
MSPLEQQSLRVLVANEDRTRLERLAEVAKDLGEEIVAREVVPAEVAEAARQVQPDIALVGLHDHHTEHALDLIGQIVSEGICPVIAVLDGEDPKFIDAAAQGGIFAYVTSLEPDALRGALAVAMQRYRQTLALEGAIGRRAVIERAKGVLMERHSVDDAAAFEMLRDNARHSGRKIVDVSEALLESHPLLGESRS